MVGDAFVGLAVGGEKDLVDAARGVAAGKLRRRSVEGGGHVGSSEGPQRFDGLQRPHARRAGHLRRADQHRGVAPEFDDGEAVAVAQRLYQRAGGVAGAVQLGADHRAGAVEDEDGVDRHAAAGRGIRVGNQIDLQIRLGAATLGQVAPVELRGHAQTARADALRRRRLGTDPGARLGTDGGPELRDEDGGEERGQGEGGEGECSAHENLRPGSTRAAPPRSIPGALPGTRPRAAAAIYPRCAARNSTARRRRDLF